ncbi:MAG: DNA mismatch endonuclease Vsr [Lysobacter sp.]|nr:DNA mismatch endonuclease Vsr [Lysobacter sp.]
MDRISPEKRSWQMAQVRRAHTGPEMIVRRFIHGLGYRYRLHDPGLPGTPDLVFPSRRKAIFVHGCFWHRHEGCRLASTPKCRSEFWQAKFDANRARDQRAVDALTEMGWSTMTIWQCEAKPGPEFERRLRDFLD